MKKLISLFELDYQKQGLYKLYQTLKNYLFLLILSQISDTQNLTFWAY
jgi:hypothetical protein